MPFFRLGVGWGHLYQGRYKSFPIPSGGSRLKVGRFVERNPLSAGVVERAEAWLDGVNSVITDKEKSRWELSLARSQPLGDDGWTIAAAKKPGLESTMRGEGGAHETKDEDGDQ